MQSPQDDVCRISGEVSLWNIGGILWNIGGSKFVEYRGKFVEYRGEVSLWNMGWGDTFVKYFGKVCGIFPHFENSTHSNVFSLSL